MQVELLALTRRNPALTESSLADLGDLPALFEGKSTYGEAIMEFAGRVCYRSTHRMGTAPDFIAARVREGHEDIIEHVVVTVRISNSVEPLYWRTLNRHCEVSDVGDSAWIVSGNTRVWLDFFRHGEAHEAIPILKQIAPKVFDEFDAAPADLPALPAPAGIHRPWSTHDDAAASSRVARSQASCLSASHRRASMASISGRVVRRSVA